VRRDPSISIARLAAHLGLAEGTVSRALNNYPDISAKTRERVAHVARELGYQPSATARRLARGVVETVGFVLPAREGHVSDPFLSELLDGIASELAHHDWDLIVAAVPDGQDEMDVADRLIQLGKVSGFIVARTKRRDERVQFLLDTGVPFVAHGRTDNCEAYSWLDFDSEKAFVEAVQYLIGLGHRRIAHLGGDMAMDFAHRRRQGYLKGMGAAALAVPDGYLVEGIHDGVSADEAMTRVLSLPVPPTAVVCVTDSVAIGAMRAISRAGLRPGREVSVIGFDGLPVGLAVDPPLTTMSQPSHKAGREVARMLRALIDGEQRPIQKLWEATLVPRASANPPADNEPDERKGV
jgi:LacI family transcriptional regulator